MKNALIHIFRSASLVLAPLLAAAILIVASAYGEYPFIQPVGLTLTGLLALLPLWLIRGNGWLRFFKRLAYALLLLVGLAVILPQYWILTPGFVGGRFVNLWGKIKKDGENIAPDQFNFLGKQILYEKISDDAMLFSYPDPPVTLLVSTANNQPHCSGYPHSAVERCTKRLQLYIESAAPRKKDPD